MNVDEVFECFDIEEDGFGVEKELCEQGKILTEYLHHYKLARFNTIRRKSKRRKYLILCPINLPNRPPPFPHLYPLPPILNIHLFSPHTPILLSFTFPLTSILMHLPFHPILCILEAFSTNVQRLDHYSCPFPFFCQSEGFLTKDFFGIPRRVPCFERVVGEYYFVNVAGEGVCFFGFFVGARLCKWWTFGSIGGGQRRDTLLELCRHCGNVVDVLC